MFEWIVFGVSFFTSFSTEIMLLSGLTAPLTSVPVLTSYTSRYPTKTSFSLQIFHINLLEYLTVRIVAIGLQYIGHQYIGFNGRSNL